MRPFLKSVGVLLVLGLVTGVIGYFVFHFQLVWSAVGSALFSQWEGNWSFPVDAAMGLVTVVALWFTAAGWGLWLIGRMGDERSLSSPWQQLSLGLLCGWVFLGTGTLLLGLAGFSNRPALGVWVLVVAAWGTRGWTPFFRRLLSRPKLAAELNLSGWVLLGAGLVYLITIPYALTPSIQSDELRYHLAAPEAWLALGQIEYLPHQAFSNFPFLIEMLYMLALALQGAEGAHMVHLAFLESCAVLIALLSWQMIRVFSSPTGHIPRDSADHKKTVCGLSGVAFAAIPTATVLACWGFVDIATCAYFLGMAYVGALMLTSDRPPGGWLLGVMAGGAMGSKYSMIPLSVAVALWLAVLLPGFRGRTAARALVHALGIALLVVSPWLIRNTISTRNPVYPLAWSIFGGDDWSEANATFYAEKAAEKGFSATQSRVFLDDQGGPGLTLAEVFLRQDLPADVLTGVPGRVVEILISPVTTGIYPWVFENHYLGPMPLVALILALAGLINLLSRWRSLPPGRRRPAAALALWIFGLVAGSWLFWFLTYQSNRMLLPSIALLFASAVWGLRSITAAMSNARYGRPATFVFSGVLALGMLHSWSYSAATISAGVKPHPLPQALGFGDREDYIASSVNYYAAARWLSGKLSEEKRALLIGEHRTLYFPPHVVASDWFDTPQPLPLIRSSPDNDELFERLATENIAYVLLNEEELRKYVSVYFRPRFTDAEWLRFQNLLQDPRLNPVWNDSEHAIYIFSLEREPGTIPGEN